MTDHTQPPLPLGGLDGQWTLTGHNHPETSHQAAAAVAPIRSKQRRLILALLADAPLIDDELLALSGLGANSARPCRVELVRLGLVEDSLRRRYNRKGHACILWQLTSKGRAALAQQ
jgi:hypothetical protein